MKKNDKYSHGPATRFQQFLSVESDPRQSRTYVARIFSAPSHKGRSGYGFAPTDWLLTRSIALLSILLILLSNACTSSSQRSASLTDELEQSLFNDIIHPWYPRCLDTIFGGYIPNLEYDWSLSDGPQNKALVQQSRHLWTTSFLYEHYPAHPEFLEYATRGYRFIEKHFRDSAYGGLYPMCNRDGSADSTAIQHKRVYGQAFAINGLSQYFRVSNDTSALILAIEIFRWMEMYPHDAVHGGYFETLNRDGTPVWTSRDAPDSVEDPGSFPMGGLKEFNSSLHVLEALTELYRVWPDSLLEMRLREMYTLFRDVFIHPEGHLKLYFYPDWTLVPEEEMERRGQGNYWYTQHITYGHDVETAFLLLEAADALGIREDQKTVILSKKLVDHALENGWDPENGGFYYIGYENNGITTIHVDHKAFWVTSEGLNALMLMYTLYPNDPMDYLGKFCKLWDYTKKYMIDHEYGGWYNYGLDTNPGNRTARKSHNWKATYHDVRGMVRSVEMLRGTE